MLIWISDWLMGNSECQIANGRLLRALIFAICHVVFAHSPRGGTVEQEHVDLLELNQIVSDCEVPFVQIIAWDWDAEYRRFDVVDWMLCDTPEDSPRRLTSGRYAVDWRRSQGPGVRRVVVADCFRQTWTQHDPEVAHKRLVPEKNRRRLFMASPERL